MKLKKLLPIIGLVFLLALLGATAKIFSNKQDALDFIRENPPGTDWLNLNITITSKTICALERETELTKSCEVCYNALLDGFEYFGCVNVDANNSLEQDKEAIKQDARANLGGLINNSQKGYVHYIARDIQGAKIIAVIDSAIYVGIPALDPTHFCRARLIKEHCFFFSQYYGLENGKCMNFLSGNKICKSGWEEIPFMN